MYPSPRCLLCLVLSASSLLGRAEAAPPGPGEGGGTRPSSALNPAISVNVLGLASWRRGDTRSTPDAEDPGSGPPSGLSLEEAELVFAAAVDPYFKADVIASLAQNGPGEEGFEADIEEAYVTALRLPRGFGLRAGKLLLPFGRHNLLHSHAFPFVQAPLVFQQGFGREGLNEVAVELSWLLPASWYSQIVASLADGRNEMFAGSRPQDLAYAGHFKNLWDLSESATLELGISGLAGKRGHEGEGSSRAWGMNLTYKYRPLERALRHAFEAQAEWMARSSDATRQAPAEKLSGGYVHARWQARRRWWLQARYERIERRFPDGERGETRLSTLVAFTPSEFSALRLEYSTLAPFTGRRDHQLLLQLNWAIGPHPAHTY